MKPGSEDMKASIDSLERRSFGMGRQDLVTEAREFDLENEGLDFETIQKGTATY